MARQVHKRLKSYFTKLLPLPDYDISVLTQLLHAFHVSIRPDGSTFGAYLTQRRIDSSLELLTVCVRLDIGERLLTQPFTAMKDIYDACLTVGFPKGHDARNAVLQAAAELRQIPVRLYAEKNLDATRNAHLERIGEQYVHKLPDVTLTPDMWRDRHWRLYFATYPSDVLRIQILSAVQWLVRNRSEYVPEQTARLFPSFFDTATRFEHTRWYEYEYVPGVSDPAMTENVQSDDDDDDDDLDDQDDYDDDDDVNEGNE